MSNQPFSGIALATSTIPLAPVTDLSIEPAAIPDTLFEYSAIDSPNKISCSPKVTISLSPVKKLTMPDELGILSAISAIILPAFAAASTASSSTLSFTCAEKLFILQPNATSCSPNLDIVLSPRRKLAKLRPLFGIVSAIAVIILPAFAADLTADSSTLPATVLEKLTIDKPNASNCLPNSSMVLSPNINLAKLLPLFGIVSAIAVIILPAFAADLTASSSTLQLPGALPDTT